MAGTCTTQTLKRQLEAELHAKVIDGLGVSVSKAPQGIHSEHLEDVLHAGRYLGIRPFIE
jgi:hypothetical protein